MAQPAANEAEEKKDAYIPEPKRIQDTPAALEAAVAEIKGQIAKIEQSINDARTNKSNAEKARESLRNYKSDGGIEGWLSDNIFRPDNPKRYKRALNETTNLINKYDELINKLVTLKSELDRLMVVIKLITTWAQDINALVTAGTLNIVFPKLDWPDELLNNAFDKDTFRGALGVIFTVGVVAVGIGATLGGGVGALYGALLGLAALGITLIIGGIMKGDKDKKLYEDWEQKAKEGTNEVGKIIGEVDTSLTNIRNYWNKIGDLLVTANLLDESKKSQKEEILTQITALSNSIAKLSTMWRSFYRHVKEDGSNLTEEAEGSAADVGKEGDSDTIKIFKLYWFSHSNRFTIDEIKKQMDLTDDGYNRLKVILLLNQGVSPNEIEKQVTGVGKDTIQKAHDLMVANKGG